MKATAFAAVIALAVAGGLALVQASTADAPARFHDDASEVLAAALAVNEAIFRDDVKAARAQLDRLEKNCRRLPPEASERFDSEIVSMDRAYHTTLARSREVSGAGDLDKTLEEFFWVERSCRICHDHARQQGRWHPPSASAPAQP